MGFKFRPRLKRKDGYWNIEYRIYSAVYGRDDKIERLKLFKTKKNDVL